MADTKSKAQMLATYTESCFGHVGPMMEAAAELRRLDGVERERDALKQANEEFAKRQEWWNAKMFEAEAERDALRADAARFEWLAVQYWVEPEATFRLNLAETEDISTYMRELRAAIDAARGALASDSQKTSPERPRARKVSKMELVRYRVWPDGTVQEAWESPHAWMSDDYEYVEASSPEDAWKLAFNYFMNEQIPRV